MTKYSKKSQQNKKNNKYRKIVDNPWKLWYHNIRPWDKGKSIEEIRAETQTGFWERLKIKKKLLTKSIAYDNINKLSMRQQQRTLKTEQYVKPWKF